VFAAKVAENAFYECVVSLGIGSFSEVRVIGSEHMLFIEPMVAEKTVSPEKIHKPETRAGKPLLCRCVAMDLPVAGKIRSKIPVRSERLAEKFQLREIGGIRQKIVFEEISNIQTVFDKSKVLGTEEVKTDSEILPVPQDVSFREGSTENFDASFDARVFRGIGIVARAVLNERDSPIGVRLLPKGVQCPGKQLGPIVGD
jgi:hypothetical protein